MGTRVTTVTPAATTSATRIRVGVGVVAPAASAAAIQPVVSASAPVAQATLTIVVPVVGIAYIDIVLVAELDNSGRYRLVPDKVVTTDGARFTLSKPFLDGVQVADVYQLEFEKAAADSIELSETFTKLLTYTRRFADTVGLPDTHAFAMAKVLADSAVLLDTPAKHLSRPLADVFSFLDAASTHLTKANADDVTTADYSNLAFTKAAFDTVTAPDALVYTLAKVLSDVLPLSDDQTFVLNKLITDGFAMNDSFDAGDGAVFSFSKGVSNVTIVGDATAKHPAKVLADAAATGDAGSLVNQNYCDITYFAEDYVGDSRVF